MRKALSVILTQFAGINNRLPADRIKTMPVEGDPSVELSAASNFLLDNSGLPFRRGGFTLSLSFAGAHSGFSFGETCLCVKGAVLYSVNPVAGTYAPLLTVGSDNRMRYCAGAGRIFFSNGAVIGEVVDGEAALFSAPSVEFKGQLPAG